MPDIVLTQSLTTADQAATIGCEDNPIVGLEVSGTFTGTLNIEASEDPNNPLWAAAQVFTSAGVGATSTMTAPGRRLINAVGMGQVRVRFNPATAGTAVVTLRAGDGSLGSGGGGGGGGGAVTIGDGSDVAEGATADAPITTTTTTAAATGIGLWKGLVNLLVQPLMAVAHGVNPTAVAAGARSPQYANRAGVPFVIGGHPNVQTVSFNFTTAQTDTAIYSVGVGAKVIVTGFLITCHNANTFNVAARLGFGTVNTPAYGAAQLIGTHPGIAAGSGFGRGGGSGIIGMGADDEDLRFTCGTPTGGSIDCMISVYTIQS